MNPSLSEKVAIVTGASGIGMGRSIALTLAREGARVAVNYRTGEQNALQLVETIRQHGGSAIPVQADLFVQEDCQRMVALTQEKLGPVDICVINPGAGWHPEPVDALNPDFAMEDLRSELLPIYHLMPLLLPEMYRRRTGRIIAIALNPSYPSPSYGYNIAKVARLQAILQTSTEAWRHGVTVNVIAPGPVNPIAGLAEAAETCQMAKENDPAWMEREDISPQDIAEGVNFLCSSAGQFITGCVLPYAFR
jgi:3-oxoacyl-[acyl-carrier protein] reductase